VPVFIVFLPSSFCSKGEVTVAAFDDDYFFLCVSDVMKMTERIELILETDTSNEDSMKTEKTIGSTLDDSDDDDDILPHAGFTPNFIDIKQLQQDLSLSDEDTTDED
jgi:hypothetical protein